MTAVQEERLAEHTTEDDEINIRFVTVASETGWNETLELHSSTVRPGVRCCRKPMAFNLVTSWQSAAGAHADFCR
jgi:hypothetical protein